MSYNLEMLAPYKGCQFEVQYPTKKVVYTNPAQINFDTAQRIVVVRPEGKLIYVGKGKWAVADRKVLKKET